MLFLFIKVSLLGLRMRMKNLSNWSINTESQEVGNILLSFFPRNLVMHAKKDGIKISNFGHSMNKNY